MCLLARFQGGAQGVGLLDAMSDSLTQEYIPHGCGCVPSWQWHYFWFVVLERANAMLLVCEEPCAKGGQKERL